MKWILPVFLLAIPCFSQEPQMPACNAQNKGQLWPEHARSGNVRICSAGLLKYSWKPLTVHVSELRKERRKVETTTRTQQPSEREARLHVGRP